MNTPTLPAEVAGQLMIPLEAIIESPTNPRRTYDAVDMADLTASVKQHGVISPVLLRPLSDEQKASMIEPLTGRPVAELQITYELVFGSRRFRAANTASLQAIPAVIRELTDAEVRELQIVENLQRKDVGEIEEAEGYQSMIDDLGYTVDALAEKIGKSRGYIYQRLKLLDLCPEARAAALAGDLQASIAVMIARIPVPSLQQKALKEILFGGAEPMSARQAQRHVQARYMLDMRRANWPLEDAQLIPLAGACEGCTKRTSCNRDMFPDIDADVCTDPDCFAAKGAALVERTKAGYIERGHQLLDQNDSSGKLTYSHGMIPSEESGLVALSEDAEIDDDGTTYRDVLADVLDDITITVLTNARGDLIECIERTALAEALAKAGVKVGVVSAPDDNENNDQDDDDAHDHNKSQLDSPKNYTWVKQRAETIEARHTEGKIATAIVRQLQQALVGQCSSREVSMQDAALALEILIADSYERSTPEELESLAMYLSPAAIIRNDAGRLNESATSRALIAASRDMDYGEICRAMVIMILDLYYPHIELGPEISPSLLARAAAHGINVAKIRAEITGEPYEEPALAPLAEPAPTPDAAAQAQQESEGDAPKHDAGNADEAQAGEAPSPSTQAAPAAKRAKGLPPVKYANPADPKQTWSGRGKKPVWVSECLAQGKTLADLEIKAAPAPEPKKKQAAGAAKTSKGKAK